MPTEHEFKYVLDIDTSEKYFKKKCEIHYIIQQGYLAFSKGMTCRIRSSRCSKKDKKKWFLTFKQKVRNRVIEIEKRIDDRDGEDLWSVCVGRLHKDRYAIKGNNGNLWEVDFFKKGNLYFVLAEVELKENSLRIHTSLLPIFIKKDLLYEVPLTDDRFGNKRLGDVEYATNLYNTIVQGEIDDYNNKEEKD